MAILGAVRSRFETLLKELWHGRVHCHHSLTWSVFRSLNLYLGSKKLGLLGHNTAVPTRRFVGSYLDIRKRYKRSPAQAAKYKNLPIIRINASFNNTVITLSDPTGKTLGWVSAGTEGFKNARRGNSTAGRQAGIAAAYKAISLGVESARVKVCGIGTGRQGAINGIESAGVRVVSVTDITPVPHNGCRPRKARRL